MITSPGYRTGLDSNLRRYLQHGIYALATLFLSADSSHAQSRLLATVGGEGDVHVVLDKPIATILLDARTVLVVEEKSAPFVKVVHISGGKRQTLGRAGAGPGEFRYVSAVAFDRETRTLALFDPAARRASFYRFTDSLTFIGSKAVPLHVTGACYLGRRLWGHGDMNIDGTIVHRLSDKGAMMSVDSSAGTTSIGHPLDDFPMFRRYVASGPLTCSSESKLLVAVSRLLGVTQFVDLASGTHRVENIPTFVPLVFRAEGRGISLIPPSSGFNDEAIAVRTMATSTSVFFGRTDDEHKGNGDYAFVQEASLSPSGRLRVAGRSNFLAADVVDNTVLCYAINPFPTLQVRTGSLCP